MKLQAIIVGAGAAGVAAATRLIRSGIRDFVVLEAEGRIGGRIHSVTLNGSTADLGAQWVHGEEGNVVYSLAAPQGLVDIDPLMSNWAGAEFYTENGKLMDSEIQSLFYGWLCEIDITGQIKLKGYKGSLGHYFTSEFESRLKKYKGPLDTSLARSFLAWYEQFEDSIDAADTWFETSGSGHLNYKDCEGNLLNMWKSGGYHSVLNLLINQLNKPEEFHLRVKLNKEVNTISWGDAGVKVTCKDGDVYEAERVLVTVSLGVLKERASSMFYPALPPSKVNAIKGLSIGTVDKIFLIFPQRWWPEDFSGFCLLWTTDNYHLPPHQGWLRYVFGFFPVTGLPHTLCGWIVGPAARHMELLSDVEVTDGCLLLLRKFLSKSYDVPDCLEMRRSQWYSNPHFRGSYSFRSMETEKLVTDASQLASPLCDSKGNPVALFAGEASHNDFFSTVHGAIETGWREADRILSMTNGRTEIGLRKTEVIIIGAGLAGLGAAKTLSTLGITDLVILEAQERAGGRAWSQHWARGGRFVESGAQWIHGEHGNPLFEVARDNSLLSNIESAEGLGLYLMEDGTEIAQSIVTEVAETIDDILEKCEQFCKDEGHDAPISVGAFLTEQFHSRLAGCDPEERRLKLLLFEWHLRFQVIDNACDKMEEISAKRWGDYVNCSGRDCNSLTYGYTSLIDVLVSKCPPNTLNLNSEVDNIKYTTCLEPGHLSPNTRLKLAMSSSDWEPPVIVTCSDGRKFGAQFVIVTCSLGILKLSHRSMFLPSLPQYLVQPIEDLGFGNITKIYLDYDTRWWKPEERGFQLVWSTCQNNVDEMPRSWTNDITGFDVLPFEGNVLLAWVGAEGARLVENIPDYEVAQHCTKVLQQFLKRPIPSPTRIFRTRWYSNKHIRGAYSHTTNRCDETGTKPEHLLQPVLASCPSLQLQLPVVMLAGEAAHPSYFSTTHGAYETGVIQAQKIATSLSPTHKSKY